MDFKGFSLRENIYLNLAQSLDNRKIKQNKENRNAKFAVFNLNIHIFALVFFSVVDIFRSIFNAICIFLTIELRIFFFFMQ